MKINYIIFLTLLGLLTLINNTSVFAQESYPEFSFSGLSNDSIESFPQAPLQSNIAIKKPLMRDILILQDQINILEGLIERQASIQQIAENYKNVGIPFIQPAPPQSSCEKLPVNMLCMNFYPDMSQNIEVVENFEPTMPAMEIENQLAGLDNFDIGNPSDVNGLLNDMPEEEDGYNWTDIQCLGNRCTALVTSSSDENFRLRVTEGDLLSDDVKVTGISPFKVTVKDKETEVTLQPLSISGDIIAKATEKTVEQPATAQLEAQEEKLESGIRQLIDNNLQTSTSEPSPSPTTPAIQATQGQSSSEGALLSPTGLF